MERSDRRSSCRRTFWPTAPAISTSPQTRSVRRRISSRPMAAGRSRLPAGRTEFRCNRGLERVSGLSEGHSAHGTADRRRHIGAALIRLDRSRRALWAGVDDRVQHVANGVDRLIRSEAPRRVLSCAKERVVGGMGGWRGPGSSRAPRTRGWRRSRAELPCPPLNCAEGRSLFPWTSASHSLLAGRARRILRSRGRSAVLMQSRGFRIAGPSVIPRVPRSCAQALGNIGLVLLTVRYSGNAFIVLVIKNDRPRRRTLFQC
jgi:hypothetical protein